jgi:hypothetical protein
VARIFLKTIFLIDNNRREAVKCAQTDSNQAEAICPARFFAPSEPANHRTNVTRKKKRKNHESADSMQKRNNSASSHRTRARLLWAFAASVSRLPRRLRPQQCQDDDTTIERKIAIDGRGQFTQALSV